MAGSVIEFLKSQKKEKSLLKKLVLDWIADNPYRLENYTEEDFEILRRLTVIGTKRDRRVFSPSGFTACQRKQVIDKHLPPQSITDPQLTLIFDDGNWRHLRWQMLFYKMGIVESMEEFLSEGELEFGGSIDLKVKLKVGKKQRRIIVDVKGANAAVWNQVASTGKPLFSHKVQILIYAMIHGIDTCILWYENKNTNRIYECVVRLTPKWEKILRRRQSRLKKYAARRAFPQEECRVGDSTDRVYLNCGQRENCKCLPVHQIIDGEVIKIAEPRKRKSNYDQFNTLPLTPLKGPHGKREAPSLHSEG